MSQEPPLRVLVVDDSAVVRQAFTALLSRPGKVEVEVAADPLIAFAKIKRARPDVILLDLEMPRMDGLTFLRQLMAGDPIPVIICSSLAGPGSEGALRALEEGAVDIVVKPQLGVRDFLEESAAALREVVRGAARARLARRVAKAPAPAPAPHGPLRGLLTVTSDQVVAVGASTGGTEALRFLLEAMPPDGPGLVIVQHMPRAFTAAFAQRLDRLCQVQVQEAADGDRVMRGLALVAPGDRHLRLVRSGAQYRVEISDEPPVAHHRPSVDVLFESVAEVAGPNALGVLLTGMGADGAAGLLKMRGAGAFTLAQDEASCVVFGMPKEAIARGAAVRVVPLSEIPGVLLASARANAARHLP